MKIVNEHGLTFEAWRAECDEVCISVCGMVCDDLPDWDYWNCWSCGMDAADVVSEMLDDNGYSDWSS